MRVSEQVDDVRAEKERLERSVAIAQEEIDILRGELTKARQLLAQTTDDSKSAR